NVEAARLRKKHVGTIVALGHLGATGGTLVDPTGPLITLAEHVTDVDAVICDNTDFQVVATRSNGGLVTENPRHGRRFTRVRVLIDRSEKAAVYMTADFHKPWTIGITPDPVIQARLDQLNGQLGPLLGTIIGTSKAIVARTDACGSTPGWTCESKIGDVVTDAMRGRYGVDVAMMNSGALVTDLTCPTADIAGDFCPAYTPPPFPITRGQILTALPFSNIVVTLTVSGAELKTYFENGVSQMPVLSG